MFRAQISDGEQIECAEYEIEGPGVRLFDEDGDFLAFVPRGSSHEYALRSFRWNDAGVVAEPRRRCRRGVQSTHGVISIPDRRISTPNPRSGPSSGTPHDVRADGPAETSTERS